MEEKHHKWLEVEAVMAKKLLEEKNNHPYPTENAESCNSNHSRFAHGYNRGMNVLEINNHFLIRNKACSTR